MPELIRKLTANGNVAYTTTPEEMRRLVNNEVKTMDELIKKLGLGPK
jgi:hypothetical protein